MCAPMCIWWEHVCARVCGVKWIRVRPCCVNHVRVHVHMCVREHARPPVALGCPRQRLAAPLSPPAPSPAAAAPRVRPCACPRNRPTRTPRAGRPLCPHPDLRRCRVSFTARGGLEGEGGVMGDGTKPWPGWNSASQHRTGPHLSVMGRRGFGGCGCGRGCWLLMLSILAFARWTAFP